MPAVRIGVSVRDPSKAEDNEAKLREAGVRWTALRNGFYANTVPTMIKGEAASTGVLAAPAADKVSWTAHVNVTAAAAWSLRRKDALAIRRRL